MRAGHIRGKGSDLIECPARHSRCPIRRAIDGHLVISDTRSPRPECFGQTALTSLRYPRPLPRRQDSGVLVSAAARRVRSRLLGDRCAISKKRSPSRSIAERGKQNWDGQVRGPELQTRYTSPTAWTPRKRSAVIASEGSLTLGAITFLSRCTDCIKRSLFCRCRWACRGTSRREFPSN